MSASRCLFVGQRRTVVVGIAQSLSLIVTRGSSWTPPSMVLPPLSSTMGAGQSFDRQRVVFK
eukprot:3019616-Pyramimonas_sp.AAC.1